MNLRSLRLFMIPLLALTLSACAGVQKDAEQDEVDLALDSDSSDLQLDSTDIEVSSVFSSTKTRHTSLLLVFLDLAFRRKRFAFCAKTNLIFRRDSRRFRSL